ncbi:hypothetical protein COO60DRAFT_1539513 [Scenedesmus sp. NREL 46B-D3]|nr:hypothetical protein COO60DRAFT_1539513 [Scenedesmus sp. NREL 46B-D3]
MCLSPRGIPATGSWFHCIIIIILPIQAIASAPSAPRPTWFHCMCAHHVRYAARAVPSCEKKLGTVCHQQTMANLCTAFEYHACVLWQYGGRCSKGWVGGTAQGDLFTSSTWRSEPKRLHNMFLLKAVWSSLCRTATSVVTALVPCCRYCSSQTGVCALDCAESTDSVQS